MFDVLHQLIDRVQWHSEAQAKAAHDAVQAAADRDNATTQGGTPAPKLSSVTDSGGSSK